MKNSTQMGQDKNIPRQGSGMKDNLMQTPEKGLGNSGGKMKGDMMGAGGPSPTGEKLHQYLSGGRGS